MTDGRFHDLDEEELYADVDKDMIKLEDIAFDIHQPL
jgi:hypothetical protein